MSPHRSEKALRVDLRVLVQLGESAADQELLDGEARMGRPGFRGKVSGLELDEAGTTGQRVGDRLHQAEWLRAGQEEGPGAPAGRDRPPL